MSQFRRRILLNPKDGYTLIHWHSGEDALVVGKWMDRVRDIPGETPLDWINYGSAWDSENRCYTSNNLSQYMTIPNSTGVAFGSDVRIEIEMSITHLGSSSVPIDFGSVTAPPDGTCALGFILNTQTKVAYGNLKYNGNNPVYPARLDFNLSGFPKSVFSFGIRAISDTNGVVFTRYDQSEAISTEFPLISLGTTRPLNTPFHLFRGIESGYAFNGSIYEIKIYKKKI